MELLILARRVLEENASGCFPSLEGRKCERQAGLASGGLWTYSQVFSSSENRKPYNGDHRSVEQHTIRQDAV